MSAEPGENVNVNEIVCRVCLLCGAYKYNIKARKKSVNLPDRLTTATTQKKKQDSIEGRIAVTESTRLKSIDSTYLSTSATV